MNQELNYKGCRMLCKSCQFVTKRRIDYEEESWFAPSCSKEGVNSPDFTHTKIFLKYLQSKNMHDIVSDFKEKFIESGNPGRYPSGYFCEHYKRK